jgi:hypothetical protein
VSSFLVVKTVNILGRVYPSSSATFEGTPLQPTGSPGVMEMPLDPATKSGVVRVTAPGFTTVEQSLEFSLDTSPPSVRFSGLLAVNALRVGVASRGADFALEFYVVVDTDLADAMDAFRLSVSGPYTLDGNRLPIVAPQFFMAGGAHRPHSGQLPAAVASSHIPSAVLTHAAAGRVTPDEIHRLMQAFIDAKFPRPADFTSIASVIDTIRMMAWEFELGIDCAGYVQQAFLASRGAKRADFKLKAFNDENLDALSARAPFRKVDHRRARTGDLFVLDPPDPQHPPGHTTIVYSHVVAPDDVTLAQTYGDDAIQLMANGGSGGPTHLYYVDASWGAGPSGNPEGGVQRRPWYFNEATNEWAHLSGGFRMSTPGRPFGHPLQAVYRPKREV